MILKPTTLNLEDQITLIKAQPFMRWLGPPLGDLNIDIVIEQVECTGIINHFLSLFKKGVPSFLGPLSLL